MTNLALATDNTKDDSATDTDSLVYIVGYAKKANARVFDTWGVYMTQESAAFAENALKRNGFNTRISSTTLYE